MHSEPKSKPRRAVFIAILGFSLASGPAFAQNVAAGETLAKTWCSSCHAIDAAGGKVSDAIPSFVAIANMSATTAASLSVFLTTPHGNMPDYALSRTEIRNVSAYIVSLRQPR